MKVRLNTIFTTYTKDTPVTPSAPLWLLYNAGGTAIKINEAFVIPRGEKFGGPDPTPLLMPVIDHYIQSGKIEQLEIINETQFTVTFTQNLPGNRFILIETFYKIEP